jgi:AcrR family transcriptional regulator
MGVPGLRGPYAKTAARRVQVLQAARESFAERGYEGSSLRDIARRAGITHAGLIHHFSNKETLLTAVLAHRDLEEQELSAAQVANGSGVPLSAAQFLAGLLQEHQKTPELMRLWAELATAASRPGHPANEYFVRRYEHARSRIAEGLRKKPGRDASPGGLEPEAIAALLLAVMDGLQKQWLLDPDLDIVAPFEKFVGLVLQP